MAARPAGGEHHGYTRQRAAEKDKQQRDSRVLRACIERDPTDAYSHFKLLELARFWRDPAAGRAQATEVLRGLEEGKLRLEGQAFGGELVALVARALHPAEPERALEVIGRWSDRCALSPALWLARGELRELSGDVEGARSDFQRCLGATDPTAQLVTTRPLLGLARLALAAGELAQASQLAAEALQGAPRDREALLLGLSLSLGRGKDEALAFAEASGPPADLLVDAVGASGRAWLSAGRVEEAGDLLLAFATRAPVLGIGSLVCDLLLGRNSELDLELDQESADEALVGWIQVLQAAPSPQLQARFWAAAPAILPVFPWLAQLLEDPVP